MVEDLISHWFRRDGSHANALGIDGYNRVSDPKLARRFPLPGQVRNFFQDFCSERAISPADIPVTVKLPVSDDGDMRPLVTGAVIMTLEEYGYGYADAAGLSLNSPSGPLTARLRNGERRVILENYDETSDTIFVSNRIFFDDDLRLQLNRKYNLPKDASEDYLMVYLVAHSTVHRVQKMQNRTQKKPEGGEYDPAKDMVESLKLKSEKEAHNTGVRIADRVWRKTFSF